MITCDLVDDSDSIFLRCLEILQELQFICTLSDHSPLLYRSDTAFSHVLISIHKLVRDIKTVRERSTFDNNSCTSDMSAHLFFLPVYHYCRCGWMLPYFNFFASKWCVLNVGKRSHHTLESMSPYKWVGTIQRDMTRKMIEEEENGTLLKWNRSLQCDSGTLDAD